MVYIMLADGFEEGEAIIPYDLFNRAGLSPKFVSVNKNKNVKASNGTEIIADLSIDEIKEKAEAVFLPGGLIGVRNLSVNETVKNLVKEYISDGVVCAICAAPTMLDEWGYIDGKNSTCYPDMNLLMKRSKYNDERVVVDGNLITGNALGAVFEFSFTIIEKLLSVEVANAVANEIYYGSWNGFNK